MTENEATTMKKRIDPPGVIAAWKEDINISSFLQHAIEDLPTENIQWIIPSYQSITANTISAVQSFPII
jgi:hypothetical protein